MPKSLGHQLVAIGISLIFYVFKRKTDNLTFKLPKINARQNVLLMLEVAQW